MLPLRFAAKGRSSRALKVALLLGSVVLLCISRALKAALLLGLVVAARSLRVLEMTLLLGFAVRVSCYAMSRRVASCHAREESGRSTSSERIAQIHAAHPHTTHTDTTGLSSLLVSIISRYVSELPAPSSFTPLSPLSPTNVFQLNFRCGVIRSYYSLFFMDFRGIFERF